jgi:S-adenosylmethionine synthetase
LQIDVGLLGAPSVEQSSVEIVERKGLGHPDSISDALAEKLSLTLSRFYRDRFGLILHHNVDKVLLCAGAARPAFGGGEVTEPIDIFLAGRATMAFKGVQVPVEELAVEGSREWFRKRFHALDAERHLRIHPLIRPGSRDLVELFLRQRRDGVWHANDTSCGVGYAPLSELETVGQAVERRRNAAAVRKDHPEIGQDIKVMGVRRDGRVRLTVACALIGRFLENLDDYAASRTVVAEMTRSIAAAETASELAIEVNAADDLASESIYLTVTGTSAEAGDDGEAGRGNRVNGLITPYRPMTMESVAGKNPVTHVGKLYNLCAGLVADAVVNELSGVASATCALVSQIGRPVNDPQIVDLRIRPLDGQPVTDIAPSIEEIVRDRVGNIDKLSEDLLDGRVALDRWPLRVTRDNR